MNTDLLQGMVPSGTWEVPTILRTNAKPNSLVPFDKAMRAKEYAAWVHFFIHDAQFLRVWRNPWRYLTILARFEGVISPDFSVFWNYPLYKQLESISHSREIGAWLQRNGVNVIPCVRWGKEDTYAFAFDGIEPGGTVAVGTVGCMREKEARKVFEVGLPIMIEKIHPRRIIVYGSRRSSVFEEVERLGIDIVRFESDTSKVFAKAVG